MKKRKKRLTLQDKAELAMKEAVRKVVLWHKKNRRKLAIWENGKVVWVLPK